MLKQIPKIKHLASNNFFLIAGPCVVESEEIVYAVAEKIKTITDKLQIPFIFKSSYRKANRTSLDSFTSIGDEKALGILKKTGEQLDIPVITDIHESKEADTTAKYVDMLQIPAFLCRQTELLIAAAKTGKPVNIKKGQFLSPETMQFAISKIQKSGNDLIMITERGTTFGYQDLIVDFRNIPIMRQFNLPIVLDCTHSLQQPNQALGVSGGKPEMIETIAKAGVAVGVDGLFIETHPDPANAKSDGANMLPLGLLENLLTQLVKIRKAVSN